MTRNSPILLVLLLGALVYLPGLTGGFAFDDYPNIVDNTALRPPVLDVDSLLDAAFSSLSGPLHRPIASLSFAAHYLLGGGSALDFKLVNLAIHLINAWLVFAIVRRLAPRLVGARQAPALAFGTTLLWTLHPLQLTAVLYVVQRMTSLSATFVLLGIAAYVAAREGMLAAPRRSPWTGFVTCVLCGLAGLFTKENAALLPLYLLVLEAAVWRFEKFSVLRPLAAGLVVVSAGIAVWLLVARPESFTTANINRFFTPEQRLLTEFRILVFYLGQILLPLPSTLSLFHDTFALSTSLLAPPTTAASLAGIVALLAGSFALRRRWPVLYFGAWWFIAGHLLESTLVQLDLVYEHRNYLPVLGPLAILVDVLQRLEARIALRPQFLVGAAALCFAALTVMRALQWSDPLALVLAEARHNPRSQATVYELGRIYHRLYEREKREDFRDKARAEFQRAIGMGPEDFMPLTALVASYASSDEAPPAAVREKLLADLRDQKPTEKRLYSLYALTLCQQYKHCRVDVDLTVELFSAALDHPQLARPVRGRLLEWLGTYYSNVLGDLPAALRILRELTDENPDVAEYRLAYAEALYVAGDHVGAAAQFARLPAPRGLWQRLTDRQLRPRIATLGALLAANPR
jgi:tetratricopeptide (TPR) repeat protein